MKTSEGWFVPTGFGLFQHITRRDRQSWDHMDPISRQSWEMRASGEHAFIPSPNHHNHEEVQTVVLPMPAPEHPVETIKVSDPVVPKAALDMAKRLHANGWRYDVRYCVGPWKKKAESVPVLEQNEEGDWVETGSIEKTTYGQAPSVVLRFRRGDLVGYAMWLAKPWTKEGDKLKFHSAQVAGQGLLNSSELIALITAPEQGGNSE